MYNPDASSNTTSMVFDRALAFPALSTALAWNRLLPGRRVVSRDNLPSRTRKVESARTPFL